VLEFAVNLEVLDRPPWQAGPGADLYHATVAIHVFPLLSIPDSPQPLGLGRCGLGTGRLLYLLAQLFPSPLL
jgi:hypothetical protein